MIDYGTSYVHQEFFILIVKALFSWISTTIMGLIVFTAILFVISYYYVMTGQDEK